jgi:hypothetical protein
MRDDVLPATSDNKILVVYHSADLDGIACREVAKYHISPLVNNVTFMGWDYADEVPSVDPVYWDLIILMDISIKAWMDDPKFTDKMVWIDHHKTAIDKWGQVLMRGRFLMVGVAACRLAWNWFSRKRGTPDPTIQEFVDRTVLEPKLIQMLGEYDIYDPRNMEDNLALQQSAGSLLKPDHWPIAFQSDSLTDRLVQRGHDQLLAIRALNTKFDSRSAHDIEWEGLKWRAMNGHGNAQTVRSFDPDKNDATLLWFYNGTNIIVSLYSNKPGLDLSPLATKRGGGGHAGACGFMCTFSQMMAILGR